MHLRRWLTCTVTAALIALPIETGCAQERPADMSRDSLIAAARDLMQAARYCALITLDVSGHPRARTMDPFTPEDDMAIWLGTSRQTRKVEEIRNDPRVTLYYAHPDGDGYVSIYGWARLVDDPQEKVRRWKSEWEEFYADREASYLLIEVRPERLEIINYSRGIDGDSVTWKPPSVELGRDRREGVPSEPSTAR